MGHDNSADSAPVHCTPVRAICVSADAYALNTRAPVITQDNSILINCLPPDLICSTIVSIKHLPWVIHACLILAILVILLYCNIETINYDGDSIITMRGQSKLVAGDNSILIVPALTAHSTPVAINTQLHNSHRTIIATG